MSPNFRNPDALQWQVSGEHEIARGVTISENFTYINTNDIARERDTNLPAPVPSASLTYNATTCPYCGIPGLDLYNQSPRPDPAFGVAEITESADHSLYRGLHNHAQRPAVPFHIRSLLHAFLEFHGRRRRSAASRRIRYADVSELQSEYAHSNIDEPNQFWSNGVYSLPLGFEVGYSMRFTSGRPYNAVTGFDEKWGRTEHRSSHRERRVDAAERLSQLWLQGSRPPRSEELPASQ